MHKFIFSEDHRQAIRTLYAHLRNEAPATAKSRNLMRRARTVVTGLMRTPPEADPEPLESPELQIVALSLVAGAAPDGRSEKEDAELAVGLYLAYELIRELKEHEPPHDR